MDAAEFRKHCYQLIDWAADCPDGATERPAGPTTEPGSIMSRLPDRAPETPEEVSLILENLREMIVPEPVQGNHSFLCGNFPEENFYPAVLSRLAETVVNAGALNRAVAPTTTGLEETVLDWLKQACGLPDHFKGMTHQAASAGTVAAVLAARERATNGKADRAGLTGGEPTLTAYASAETYSALEQAIGVAGLGRDNLRLVSGEADPGLDPDALAAAIEADRRAGRNPTIVAASVGLDPLRAIGEIARREGLFFHVNAAEAGMAALLPEKRSLFDGLDTVDSYIFSLPTWLGVNTDWAIQYVAYRDGAATNCPDRGVDSGWRFPALEIWFAFKRMGLRGVRNKLRGHMTWAQELAAWIEAEPGFELVGPVPLQTVRFTWRPVGRKDRVEINRLNRELVSRIKTDGRMHPTQCHINDQGIVGITIGVTNQVRDDVVRAWEVIKRIAIDLIVTERG